MNKLLFSILVIAVLTSCSKKYQIEGISSVSSLDGKKLFLKVFHSNDLINIDSSEVVHGKFSFKGKIDSTMMAMLYMDDKSIMPLVVEPGKINITITNSEQKISGSPLNNKFYSFIDKKNTLEFQMQELYRKEAKRIMNGEDIQLVQAESRQEADALSQEMKRHIERFIIDNCDNVLGPTVFIMLCNSFPHPVITPEIEEIVKKTSCSFKSNYLVKEYLGKAKENMRFMQEQASEHKAPIGN